MIKNSNNILNSILPEIISCEEIICLALENLEHKKGGYYALIREYILNFKKIDKKINSKVRKIIAFVQTLADKTDEKHALKKLERALDKLGAKRHKSIYFRVCEICIKYNLEAILENMK
ncbi:hypothetical protein IJ531_03435 [bacterium]|nr:hypothetical protein [bacterium]